MSKVVRIGSVIVHNKLVLSNCNSIMTPLGWACEQYFGFHDVGITDFILVREGCICTEIKGIKC